MSAPDERWYETAFGAASLALYSHRDLAEAREQVEHLVSRGFGGALVDLGCGAGRHLVALAERGVMACGVDLSLDAIAAAPTSVRPRVVHGDLRRLPFRDGVFDGALSMFSSFGYFEGDGDLTALREAARVLRPGGSLCLDLAEPDAVRASLVPESRRRVGDISFHERRELVDGGRVVTKRVEARDEHGVVATWVERLRLYDRAELRELGETAGFEPHGGDAGWDGEGAGPHAARRIRIWRRRDRL